MRRIRFTRGGSNTLVGNFANGDLFSCSDALARHLVEEARCAKYVEPTTATPAPAPSAQARRRRAVSS